MKNLVITPAVGLEFNPVEFFIKSLRKYYQDDIYFIVGPKDLDLKRKLKFYNCKYYEVNVHKFDVQLKRYKYFLNILRKNNNYNKVLFCDCRDIYFQSNPFDYQYKGLINFFLEDNPINQCPVNSKWIIKTLGEKIYKEMANNMTCCSGTILGSVDSMIQLSDLMNAMSVKYPFKKSLKYLLTFRRDKEGRGCDQAYINYLIHKKHFKNSFLYTNHGGPIATVFYLRQIKFNEKYQLINGFGKPYAIVHQYDKRWPEFSEKVNFIKSNLKLLETSKK